MKYRKNELGFQLMKGQASQLHNWLEFNLQPRDKQRPHKAFLERMLMFFSQQDLSRV